VQDRGDESPDEVPAPWLMGEPWQPGVRAGDPLASVGRRVLARIVSLAIWSMVLAVLLSLTDLVVDLGDEPPRVLFYLFWLLPPVVDIVLVATRGWDPGKYVLGLRVVGPSGGPPGLVPAMVRTVVVDAARVLSVLPAGLSQLGSWLSLPWAALLIWTMANNSDRQGWQDRAAGTYVIDRKGVASFRALLHGTDRGA
jgi:uncharacterized RDD family membrane protein YckC